MVEGNCIDLWRNEETGAKISKWPEGLVFFVGNRLIWKSWETEALPSVKPNEIKVTLALDASSVVNLLAKIAELPGMKT